MYHKITKEDLAALEKIAPERVFGPGEIGDDYSHDELGGVSCMPEALIKAESTEEISAVMSYAYEKNIPVVVRGAGTGLVGGCTAVKGGIMLETLGMDKVLELDQDNMTVTVQPGVLLMNLAAYVEEKGLFYPPDPGEKTATIGGNISTNAGGMRAVKYGVTRDYVRGLTVVLPTGNVVSLGGKIVKNSSGYSLKDLIIGSEGTLGIITEAVLKLIPLPQCTASLLVPFKDMETALEAVPQIARSQVTPTAIEYLSRDVILCAEEFLGKQFPDKSSQSYLLLTVDGKTEERVESDSKDLADICLEQGAEDVYFVDTEERKKSVWDARGAFLEAIKASAGEMDECDVVVPRNRVAEYLRYIKTLSDEIEIRIPVFGHAGDGNLHIYICRDSLQEDEFAIRKENAFDRMYKKAGEMGGLVSGEHGVGWAKKPYFSHLTDQGALDLMRGIKKAFDPKNLLNPDKIL